MIRFTKKTDFSCLDYYDICSYVNVDYRFYFFLVSLLLIFSKLFRRFMNCSKFICLFRLTFSKSYVTLFTNSLHGISILYLKSSVRARWAVDRRKIAYTGEKTFTRFPELFSSITTDLFLLFAFVFLDPCLTRRQRAWS